MPISKIQLAAHEAIVLAARAPHQDIGVSSPEHARQSKVAAAMRPGVVVVLDVGKNADEVSFAADQEPVQAFGAGALIPEGVPWPAWM
jgi:hypothetical protein